MRVAKEYGKRSGSGNAKKQPKIRYFLAFEGEMTEPEYFKGIIGIQQLLGIDDIIEITPLLRNYDQRRWSNPEKICNLVIKDRDDRLSGNLTISTLISHLTDWIRKEFEIPEDINISNVLIDTLVKCGYNDTTSFEDNKDDIIQCICGAIRSLHLIEVSPDAIQNFKKYLKNQRNYTKGDGDKICIIVDRDKDSFTENQYDKVVDICNREHIEFYITNPRFEFWLLLHFVGKNMIEPEKIDAKANPGELPYLEQQLLAYLPGFDKRTVPFDQLTNRIGTAIQNEKDFPESILELKDSIGSNIGILLTKMKNRK